MPSKALLAWKSDRARSLDEIENAHASIGGTGPGRRYATQQMNQAYAVMVASQFQGFCRDLHTGSVTVIVDIVQPPALLTQIVRNRFMLGRQFGEQERSTIQPGFRLRVVRYRLLEGGRYSHSRWRSGPQRASRS